MTEERRGCWICGCPSASKFRAGNLSGAMTASDTRITDDRYGLSANLVRCVNCRFVYASPLPAADLVALYEGLVDQDYQEGAENRTEQMGHLLRKIKKINPSYRTLLDVGASTGLLVAEARRQGFAAEGIEPSTWAVSVAESQNDVRLHRGIFPHPDLRGQLFDVIAFVDVIEHVEDPVGLLRAAKEALAPGGLLVVTTPDVDSAAARLLGARWWHYRPAHVCFFDWRSMDVALAAAGLRLHHRERQTWWFPVSYLARRVENYLPVRALNDQLQRVGPLARLWNAVVPLDLRDSWVYYCNHM